MLAAILLAASILALQDGVPGAFEAAPPPPAVSPSMRMQADATARPTNSGGPASSYSFELRDIQVDRFDWRQPIERHVRRLDWQAGATVWAIGNQGVFELLEWVQGNTRANLTQAPEATAAAGESTRTLVGSAVYIVAGVEFLDGVPDAEGRPTTVRPIAEQLHNGIDAALSATPDGDDLILGVNLDETSIREIHHATASFETTIAGGEPPEDRPLLGLFRRLGESDPAVAQAGASKLQTSYQMPEINRAHVEGAWPLRPGESLLISLGARSKQEKWGKQAVSERLVLITARADRDASNTMRQGLPASTPPLPSPGLAPTAVDPDAPSALGLPFDRQRTRR